MDLSGDGAAAALGLPVDIGGAVKYSTKSDFGAILMCDSDVVMEGYDLRAPFKKWLKANSKKLLENYGELEKYGVIAATWTYSSDDIYIKT